MAGDSVGILIETEESKNRGSNNRNGSNQDENEVAVVEDDKKEKNKPMMTTTTTTAIGDDPATATTVSPDASTAMEEEVDPRQIIDMLGGDDIEGRISAANRLESVAAALGEKRTREELLPFLVDGVDDEDEVLAAIASSLGTLVPHVGGPNHAYTLLTPLEMLLAVEESTVRDNAVKSAEIISNQLPIETFRDQYASLLSRLANKEWFTARISACSLIASAFNRLDPDQQETHLEHFASLCRDDAPMVRRVASQHLGSLLLNVVTAKGKQCVEQDGMLTTTFLPLYEELASNEQPDSVRLQSTENCIAFGKAMTGLFKNDGDGKTMLDSDDLSLAAAGILVKRILPLIVSTIDDRSWRVRWTAASKFADVVKSFTELEGAMDSLIPAYEKFLEDPEAEVRTAATLNLADVGKCNSTVLAPPSRRGKSESDEMMDIDVNGPRVSVAERLVKKVTTLTEDDSENVRAALAMVATELAPVLGKDSTISYLVPPVLLLLGDATSEVRLNVISSLGALNEVIGVDILSESLLPAILDLAKDGKWRIRLAIMQHIPLLAKQLGKDFFSGKLTSLCVGWLGDDISSVRQAAAINLKELTVIFGAEWATVYLIPPLEEIRRHRSYLRRLTAVQAFSMMATEMGPEMARTEILPVVLEMASDVVPNIRFNVAQGLERMAPVCGSAVYESQIRPVLSMLAEDADRDVRFYAKKTLKSIEKDSAGGQQ